MITNNVNFYISSLCTPLYLDILNKGDKDNAISQIPFDFLSEENGAKKFKESVKKVSIRGSIEYKHWVKWFKECYNPVECCLSHHTVTIQVHHHPLVLEDYFDMALYFLYSNKITYTSGLITDLVMRWHYQGIVPACYLSKTEHENWHENHDKTIPEECIYGDLEGLLTDPITSQLLNQSHYSKIITYMPEFYKSHKELFKEPSKKEEDEFEENW